MARDLSLDAILAQLRAEYTPGRAALRRDLAKLVEAGEKSILARVAPEMYKKHLQDSLEKRLERIAEPGRIGEDPSRIPAQPFEPEALADAARATRLAMGQFGAWRTEGLQATGPIGSLLLSSDKIVDNTFETAKAAAAILDRMELFTGEAGLEVI